MDQPHANYTDYGYPDYTETTTTNNATNDALPIPVSLIVVLSLGACALLGSLLLYLGERRARLELEANARAFRADAILTQGIQVNTLLAQGVHCDLVAEVVAVPNTPNNTHAVRGVALV